MTDHHRIQYAIHEADISHGSALEGDCAAIARALKSVFGGEYIVVVDGSGNPRHAAVRIDGQLYDGTGRATIEGLVSMFAWKETTADSVEDCDYLRVVESLLDFRRQPDLTADIEQALRDGLNDQ